MKKYLYLLIACTMMCFAGCEEKGDEITTENTGENVEINEADLVGTWEFVSYVGSEYDFVEDKCIDVDWFMYNSDKERWEEYELYDKSGERFLWGFYEEVYFFLTLNADKTYTSKSLEKNRTDFDKGADNPDYDEYELYSEDNGTWSLSKDGAFSLKMKKLYVKATEEGKTKEATFNSYEEYFEREDLVTPEVNSDWFWEERLEHDDGEYDYLVKKREDVCSIKELTSTSLVMEIKPSDKTMEEMKKLYKETDNDKYRMELEVIAGRSILTFKKVK